MTATDNAAPTETRSIAVNDIGDEAALLAAIDATIKYFNDGDIVEGTIVKVDRDEVLSTSVTRPKASSRAVNFHCTMSTQARSFPGDEVEALCSSEGRQATVD